MERAGADGQSSSKPSSQCMYEAPAPTVPPQFPQGLIGEPCDGLAWLDQVPCRCLIDTGSQVSIISESFYSRYLSHRELFSIKEVLDIEGAAGQKVPYVGYIEAKVQFPESACGTDKCFNILALVSPDQSYNDKFSLLVGTNVLGPMLQDCQKKGGAKFLQTLPIDTNWVMAYTKCFKQADPQADEVKALRVALSSKVPVHLKPGEVYTLKAICHTKPGSDKFQALVCSSEDTPTPGGFIIYDQIVDVKPMSHCKFKVAVKNASRRGITLYPGTAIAECSPIDWAVPVALPDLNPQPEDAPLQAQSLLASHSEDGNQSAVLLGLDFGDSPISPQFKEHIQARIVKEASDAFSKHDLDVGSVTGVSHRIELEPHVPFKERTRRVSPADFNDLKRHLQDLLATGIIEESHSPYASPVVLVRKKNGELRMVVDYRRLNNLTKKDAYPLPRIEETFTLLSGSKWFTVLDLKSGYYQLEVEPCDRPKTAFTTPFGTWQFRRMPQGLTNSPATFQRTMEKVMEGINLQEVVAFLDDLIIFSNSLEEHEERVMKVLKRIAEFGLKLSPSKCKFFQTSVKYLGHVISAQGIQPDPDKITAVKDWPCPQTAKELRSFLGFTGYYRRFVRDYSCIVRPLNDLLKGELAPRHKGQKHWPRTKSPSLGAKWTPACQAAFDLIVEKLISAPVLAFANWQLPYVVHTDASMSGLGAALYQVQDGQTRVVAYASRGLSKSEKNYPVHKLEFLALKWAVSEKFHDYLYGANFKVLTDNNPLTYVLTSAKLDAASHRWLASLSIYNFDIHYKSGQHNTDADGLSRRPHGPSEEDEESLETDRRISSMLDCASLSPEEFKVLDGEAMSTVCKRHSVNVNTILGEGTQTVDTVIPAVETLLCNDSAVPDDLEDPVPLPGQSALPGMSMVDWYQLQRNDSSLARIIGILETGDETFDRKSEEPEVVLFLREKSKLLLVDGVLYRRVFDQKGKAFHQLVIPNSHRERAFQGVHDETGHMGIERTLELARARFYWPKMASYIENKCKTCERCVKRKARVQKASKLVNIKVSGPLELVCIDFLTIEPDSRDTRNILVLTDHFTKYAQAYPTRDQTAKTVSTVLWENFISHYGFPRRIHSDQGACFESEIVAELCKLAGITKSRTTPYHPRGNPVERFNRTLLDLLGTLEDKKKEEWRKYVRPLVHAYNCTKHDATGEAPFLLMFGREPRLPIDLCFGHSPRGHSTRTHIQYVRELKSRLKYAYDLASRNAEKRQLLNKRRWDAKVTALPLEVGDRVLVRNLSLRKKHKISDKWEPIVHIVVKQTDESIPVYVIRPEDAEGRERVLHRDMLLPCGFLPVNLQCDSQDVLTSSVQPLMRVDAGSNTEETRLEEEFGQDEEINFTSSQFPDNDLLADQRDVLGEQEASQPQYPLNPGAPEFIVDLTGSETANDEEVLSPAPTCGRPQRRRVPPAYLSDYQVGYKVDCKHHSSNVPMTLALLNNFFLSLQQQIAGLVQSLSGDSDGDVTL